MYFVWKVIIQPKWVDAPNSSYRDKMLVMALNCDWLFFHAVSAMECNAKNASAPASERNVPDIFC